MFTKQGYSTSPITKLSKDAVLADPIILDRFTKLAYDIKSVAPKSDDFLYFSIIFLKAAESALLDDQGNLKKVGSEKAWGYFDEGWKWHGNVKSHKNNNGDIFPEIELKKAASKWIGMPLCKDHESSSVDGIRGIILDTFYDEKMKQVVGLCALDRVNYADLARKVETGIVRYGSMGTAVETSVCSDCQHHAKVASDYCSHVKNRTAWGEINVGLKPLEYSLVVQPAEPGAILLRCIASLQDYKKEFINYGVDNFDEMIGKLSLDQAQHLNTIVKTACGEEGCSTVERKKIIASFLKNNNLIGPITVDAPSQPISGNQRLTSWTDALSNPDELISKNQDGTPDYTGTSGSNGTVATGNEKSSERGNVFLNDSPVDKSTPDKSTPDISTINSVSKSNDSINKKVASNKNLISTIMEDIMTESQLKKRAELRRKLAYHQGGANGVEPTGFKSKPFSVNEDKHMKQTKSMGGKETLFPGDEKLKQKLSRAELEERQLKRVAYFQGGADKKVEPAGFKSKPFSVNEDKHMKQTKSMGGKETLFPGDEKLKQSLKRANYEGPALSTKLSWPVSPVGAINKSAALFEVFAGNKKVIAATGGEIFGNEIGDNWDFFTSKEYGQEVCKQIRATGLDNVVALLKGAQVADPTMPSMAPAGAPPAPPMLDMGAAMPPVGDEADGEATEHATPKDEVEESLTVMEGEIDSARKALAELSGGEDVNVNVNVGDGESDTEGGPLKLSHSVFNQLKTVLAEMNESADELAMIAETYSGASRLSDENKKELDKIANASLKDSSGLIGQSKALVKMATAISGGISKVAKVAYAEDMSVVNDASDMTVEDDANDSSVVAEDDASDAVVDEDSADDGVNALMAKAMDLRRTRREQLVVEAAKKQDKMQKMRDAKKGVKSEKKDEKPTKKEEKKDEKPAKKDEKVSKASVVQDMVNSAFTSKKADEDKDSYKVKLRRAYDIAIEMQKKGLLSISKTALDKQVDDIMEFDDKAFESFKRTVANARTAETVKTARDLGGVNVGVESSQEQTPVKSTAEVLSMLWG